MLEQITIGCDPEIFVASKSTGVVHSAHGLLNGDKYNPEIVDLGAIQIDGMALEFNILPATSLKEFLRNINTVMATLNKRIQDINPDLEFRITPVAHFTEPYMATVPYEAKKLGCEPDYNAYTGHMNKTPSSNTLMRTAAGHIHIGWTEGIDPHDNKAHFRDCQIITQQLDATLFALSPLWDDDKERRNLYGAKGAFRPKSYGVEYRVLSNRWIQSTKMQAWVYQATMRSLELLAENKHLYKKDMFHIRGPAFLHRVLVRDYGFPSLPNIRQSSLHVD
jgi:hypothetical protein